MFKKSLVAVAALATFSAGAMAANVELYGVVDMGFSYTHTSHQEKSDKFVKRQPDGPTNRHKNDPLVRVGYLLQETA